MRSARDGARCCGTRHRSRSRSGAGVSSYARLHRREYLAPTARGRRRSVRNTGVMAADRDVQLLAFVRELERQDVDVAARIETVTALLDRVDAVRAGARRVF